MSIADFEFRTWLETRLSTLSKREKVHSLYRLVERLRLIHNYVGATTEMRKDTTVQEFQTAHPVLYSKLAPELATFVVDGYLSEEGWNYFTEHIFDPRNSAVHIFIGDLKQQLMTEVSPDEIDPFE